jgi:hypothetical protein
MPELESHFLDQVFLAPDSLATPHLHQDVARGDAVLLRGSLREQQERRR